MKTIQVSDTRLPRALHCHTRGPSLQAHALPVCSKTGSILQTPAQEPQHASPGTLQQPLSGRLHPPRPSSPCRCPCSLIVCSQWIQQPAWSFSQMKWHHSTPRTDSSPGKSPGPLHRAPHPPAITAPTPSPTLASFLARASSFLPTALTF